MSAINAYLCNTKFMNKTISHFWFSCLVLVSITVLVSTKSMTPEIGSVLISTIIGSYIGNKDQNTKS
jgi:hypothetical protein